ncbi:MAG: SpaA isopeptide-forming pilin-related protein [Defluviitaleaceae bacterium]|nr:SpaA isopeptide-forming pilin-related protein [Defluviitaleaceae bacterium]
MDTTPITNRKGRSKLATVGKSILHIAVYIVLGLILAFFINHQAQAAELDDPPPQYGNETMANGYNGYTDNGYADPPPATPTDVDTGILLVHSRAEDTNIPLGGTVFAVHRTIDNSLVVELTTDVFGEALYELPVGNYFLRKITVPYGFVPNTDRINFAIHADRIEEVTVFSRVVQIELPPQPGRLVIVNRTESINASLNGSVFAIFNAMNDHFIAEVITNQFGEATFDLPAGDYYIRQLAVPFGIVLNTERFNFRINDGEVRTVTVINRLEPTPTPPPTTTPPPADEYGRLIVIVRTDGTREIIQGAAFTVHNSMTDEIVARLTTDRFGEASVQLPVGDFFLRQTASPSVFSFSTDRIPVRIQANAIREIAVTNMADELTDAIPADGLGRLLLFKRADDTRELLQGAVFALHEAEQDRHITTLTTDMFGEATFTLPAGNYYLRQVTAPYGFVLNQDRINFQITANETRELTVSSRAEPTIDTPTDATGRLLVTVRAHGTGENLQGVDFSVHDGLTDEVVGSLTTDAFGEASLVLPVGEFFIRQTSQVNGFIMNTDRIPVRIRDNAVTDIFVTRNAVPQPTPPPAQNQGQGAAATPTPTPEATEQPNRQGRIEIITRAAGSGDLLSGGIYAVYRASDSTRMGQVTTGVGGMAYIMAEPGMYFVRELRPTFGFLLETERIFLEVSASGTTTIDLTKVRDWNIVYLPPGEDGSNFIYITQTGQYIAMPRYVGGGILIAIALAFGGLATLQFVKKITETEGIT